jgi:hypothetical protein
MTVDVEWVKVGVEAAKVAVAVFAGLWAYWLFFKQRTIAPHIEFDVSCRFFGPQEDSYVAEYTFTFLNKGLVRQDIKNIAFTVRGIKKNIPLEYRKDRSSSLSFPDIINHDDILFPSDFQNLFIEPGVNQNVRHVAQVGVGFSFIRVSAEFLYRKM